MLIYTYHITPRVRYTFDFVFSEILGLDFELTANLDFFKASDEKYKWAYDNEITDSIKLPAADLLFENDIRHQETERIVDGYIIPIYRVENDSETPFDIFASIFYLLSRYEEYLPCVKDEHGRYAAFQSIALQYGFLDTAMVNRYIFWLMDWIKKHFPELDIKLSKPKALITIDVDHPFYSKDVGLKKWLLRSMKQMSFFQEKDRYDTYEYILETLGDIPSIFFFSVQKTPSENDNFNHRESDNFKHLIQFIQSKSRIGLHPSYYSQEQSTVEEEAEWLSKLHERNIKSSRFHYLKMDIEIGTERLLKSHIQNDFSLAYGTHTGFRSSTTFPFYLFDLHKNRKSSLKIYTPCIMDSVFKYGNQENFIEKCDKVIDEVKNYGGIFIPIFHNDILADEEWQKNFEYCINRLKNEF